MAIKYYKGDPDYRDFLIDRIEGDTGSLHGWEGDGNPYGIGLSALDTPSLEKLYRSVLKLDPHIKYQEKLDNQN